MGLSERLLQLPASPVLLPLVQDPKSQISLQLQVEGPIFFPSKQGVRITATSTLNLSNRNRAAPSSPSRGPGPMSVIHSAPPCLIFDLPQSSMFLRIAALGTSDPLVSSSPSRLEDNNFVDRRRETGGLVQTWHSLGAPRVNRFHHGGRLASHAPTLVRP
jgi:hypothetical protein